jgi:PAS domain S-box-containing protein
VDPVRLANPQDIVNKYDMPTATGRCVIKKKTGTKKKSAGPDVAVAERRRRDKRSGKPPADRSARKTRDRMAELERRNRLLSTVVRISGTILRYTDLNDILAAVTRELHDVLNFDRSSVAFLSADGQNLQLSHIHTAAGPIDDPANGRRFDLDESTVAGWVAIHRQPMLRRNIRADRRFREVVAEARLGSDMVVPLVAHDRLIGTLNVGSRAKNAFGQEDLENLVHCANFVCAAIEHVLLLREARDMEERYRTVQKHASDVFLLVDRNTGELVEVNRKCCEAFGYDEDEFRGRSFFDLFPQEDQLQARRDFINVLSNKSRLFVDRRLIRRDGEIVFADINASLITIKSDTFIQVMVHDNSQRKMLEEQIIRQNRNLQSANKKLRDIDLMKTEFLANISHELRTPLSIIIAYSESLRDEDISEEDRRQFLDIVMENGQNLLQLIDDLLDLSRLETSGAMLNTSLTHVHDVLRSIWPRMERQAGEKQISLELEAGENIPATYIDNRRIQQVVLCLIQNAIKFTDPEGFVRVKTSRDSNRVRVDVEDNGAGIAPDKLPRIFDTFSQLDGSTTRKWGGLGIGLTMARHIVEMHDGKIIVNSEEGEGSVFSFTLPINSCVFDTGSD